MATTDSNLWRRVVCRLIIGLMLVLAACQPRSGAFQESEVLEPPEAAVAEPTEEDPSQRAVDQIVASSISENPFLRANAIEAGEVLSDRILPLAGIGLEDENEAVRFAALAMVGKWKLIPLVPTVANMRDDPSRSVQAAVLFALHRCGRPVNLSPLARMLTSSDATLSGNVALLLGRLDEPSAIGMLKDMAKLPPPPQMTSVEHAIVKLQVAEAIVILGDQSQREAIRAAAYSEFIEVRIAAVRLMGQLEDRLYQGALVPMLKKNPIEFRLAAAESLARLGDDRGLATVLRGCDFRLPPVRAQAALALAHFSSERAGSARARMLEDPSEQVRLAAAAAILRAASREKR